MSSDVEEFLRYQEAVLAGGVETFTSTPLRTVVFVLLTVGGGVSLMVDPGIGVPARIVGGWLALSGAVVVTAAIHGLPDFIGRGP